MDRPEARGGSRKLTEAKNGLTHPSIPIISGEYRVVQATDARVEQGSVEWFIGLDRVPFKQYSDSPRLRSALGGFHNPFKFERVLANPFEFERIMKPTRWAPSGLGEVEARGKKTRRNPTIFQTKYCWDSFPF